MDGEVDRQELLRASDPVRSLVGPLACIGEPAGVGDRRRRDASATPQLGRESNEDLQHGGRRGCLSGVGDAGGNGTEEEPPVHVSALETVEWHAVPGEAGREAGAEVRGEQLLHQLAAWGGLMIDVAHPDAGAGGLVDESDGRVGHCGVQCCSAHDGPLSLVLVVGRGRGCEGDERLGETEQVWLCGAVEAISAVRPGRSASTTAAVVKPAPSSQRS